MTTVATAIRYRVSMRGGPWRAFSGSVAGLRPVYRRTLAARPWSGVAPSVVACRRARCCGQAKKRRESGSRPSGVCPGLLGQEEGGFFADLDVRVVDGGDVEVNRVRTGLAGFRRHADDGVERGQPGCCGVDFRAAGDFGAGQAVDADPVAAWLFFGVHDLEHVDVLDPAVLGFAGEHRAVADDVDLERDAVGQEPAGEAGDQDEDGGVQQDAWANDVGHDFLAAQVAGHGVFGRVADQPLRQADLVHDLIADVDAGGAADALVLQAVADVDAGWADLHAESAIDAIAEAGRLGIDTLRARPARLAAFRIVGDDQRIRVEHHALEAGVGAHVLADLLAHEAGEQVGEAAVEEDPEGFPGAEVAGADIVDQLVHRREVADQREAGPQREDQPERMLGTLDAQLAGVERRLVELDAGAAVAFDPVFHPHENLRVDRLRAGVAAEQPAGDGGDQEQRVGRDDQQGGEVDDVLRPENDPEDVELAFDQVQQDGLATVPDQPGADVEQHLREDDQGDPPVVEMAADTLGVDFPAFLVERDGGCAGRLCRGFGLAHRSSVGGEGGETGAASPRVVYRHKAGLRGALRGVCRQTTSGWPAPVRSFAEENAWERRAAGFLVDRYQDACLLVARIKLSLNQDLAIDLRPCACVLPQLPDNSGSNDWRCGKN